MPDLPLSYRWLSAQGLTSLIPWYFCAENDNSNAEKAFEMESSCGRKVKVFARRQDNDDCAGFIIENAQTTNKVIYFHPSYSDSQNDFITNSEHDSLYSFVARVVFPDTNEWSDEDELKDLT